MLGHITTAFGDETGHQHDPQPPKDAGNVAAHEQGSDGDAARYRGVDDQGIARRDQHTGRGRGDIDRGAEGGIVIVLLLDGGHDAADGRRRGDAGAADGAKQHVGHHVGLSQGAGQEVADDLGVVDQTDGDATIVHQVAGQDEEGNGQ
ncbi:hypothetical protein D3C87_1602470 [compost metagenome]